MRLLVLRSCDFFCCPRNGVRSSISIYFLINCLVAGMHMQTCGMHLRERERKREGEREWKEEEGEREREKDSVERKSAYCAMKITFLHSLSRLLPLPFRMGKNFGVAIVSGFIFFLLFFFFHFLWAFLRLHSTGRTRNSCWMKLIFFFVEFGIDDEPNDLES